MTRPDTWLPKSHVVGRGSDEIDLPNIGAKAVTPKPPVNAKKIKVLLTVRLTDGPTDKAGGRVTCTRLKRL